MLTITDCPDQLLSRQSTSGLIEWLDDHDLELSLYELDTERHRRGIRPPMRNR